MTTKRFQSGHEVLSHFVPAYDAQRNASTIYNHTNGLSGKELGSALLKDLREELVKIIEQSASAGAKR
jgi:hypothetical protein